MTLKNILSASPLLGFSFLLAACSGSGSLATGDDEVATQCVVLDVALKKDTHFVHSAANVCDKTINVLVNSSLEAFAMKAGEDKTFELASATPEVAACYDPYLPDVKESNGKFQCRKK